MAATLGVMHPSPLLRVSRPAVHARAARGASVCALRAAAPRVARRAAPHQSVAAPRPSVAVGVSPLVALAGSVSTETLLAALSTPQGLAAAAVAGLLVLGAAAAAAGQQSTPGEAALPFGAPPPPPPREAKDAVLVFGAGGRLGSQVVTQLLAAGRCVVAASRDAAKTQAALEAALPAESLKKLFVRGGVDVTNADTLTADLFAGCTQVVSATGAVFGKNAAGQMGYIDNMTSERVDALGNANIAAAAAKHLPRNATAAVASPPLITFDTEEAVARWRRMDDVIMGGQSASAWAQGGAEGSRHGVWSGQVIVEGGGFCGCRCDGLALDLGAYDGLTLRVRGDGQRYKVNLKTAANDGKPESTYQAVLDTSASAGQWATLRLGWHAFVGVTRQMEDPATPPLDPTTVRSLGLVLSRFEFNGLPNYDFTPGDFKLEIESIGGFRATRPALVLLSSAGVERNARIGDDVEARKKDIPIVQLNPGGVLNHKYKGEAAIRFAAGGLPYCIVRPTGLDAGADTSATLELGQGDAFAGKVSRAEVAAVTAAVLASPAAAGTSFELRRSEAAVDAGKTSSAADLSRALLRLVPDAGRTGAGLRPLPAPVEPPAPATPARREEILSRPDVQASVAAGRGARTRTEAEVAADASVTPSNVNDAALWIANWRAARAKEAPAKAAPAPAAAAGGDENAVQAQAWIDAWRAKQAK